MRPSSSRMKPGVLLLNVARGGVIDEQDLADALRSGKVGGAGIDVFNTEPPTGSPLLDAPNTLLTPHLGASTAEAQVAVAEEVAEQILDVLDGRSARYAVNAPLLTPETAQAIAPYLPLAETLGRVVGAARPRGAAHAHARDRGRARVARLVVAGGGRPARPAGARHRGAGEPGQRGHAGQGPRDHGRRAQDARTRAPSPRCSRSRRRRRAGRSPSPAPWPTASRA